MLTLTKQVDYGLVAVAGLAEQKATEFAPISATRLSEDYGLPKELLSKVLKKLHRARILGSTRGARGGYYLSQPSSRVSVLDIIEALEGPVRILNCCDEPHDNPEDCQRKERCPITSRIRQVSERINALFRQITVRDLLQEDANAIPLLPTIKREGEVAREGDRSAVAM